VGEAAARVEVRREARGGFAWWVGFEGGFLLNDPWLHGDGIEGRERARGYQSDVLCERAGAWLARAADGGAREPQFAVVSLEAPHPPYDAPTPVGVARMRAEEVVLAANVPRGGEVEARARWELAGYYAHIAATDAALGRLLARVPAETIVVFTSVHGDMHGAHGLFRKGWPHEESVRVPFLVRGAHEKPGAGSREPGARVSEEAVSLVDLLAMAVAWSEGRAWTCPRERAEISMPCVVALPHQCDRVWRGWRSATGKRVWDAAGKEWALGE
jgi:Sulfatase